MASDQDDVSLILKAEVDVLRARKEVQRLARKIGMNTIEAIKTATSVSEIAYNALFHAQRASIRINVLRNGARAGISVIVADKGPGIPDLEAAMRDGYSTRNSLGIGLGAARRMMDTFDIDTEIGKGTTVAMTKWMEEPLQ